MAIGLIVLFVVIDVYDGVIARSLGLETGLRRGLDGTVDKVSIHLVAIVACTTLPSGLIIWGLILVRDIAQAAIGMVVLHRLRVVAAGAKWHRAFTTGVAVWGVAVIATGQPTWALAAPMLVLGAATLGDYARQCSTLLRVGYLHGRHALETDQLEPPRGV